MRPPRHRLASLSLVLVLALTALPARAADERVAPRVVVSILPIHSLVAGIMAGVARPVLLLAGAPSPHAHALRPSEARSLAAAELIFWVGPALERFLERPLRALSARARVVALIDAPGLRLLPARRPGSWTAPAADIDVRGRHQADPHVWLDPGNATAMARAAARALAAADPGHAAAYRANAEALAARIAALDDEVERALAPVRDAPYLVFHDAYHYFERRYRLAAAAAVAVDPERRPGARRVRQARAAIKRLDARCLFAEPQFAPAIINTIVEGTGARAAALDPLGFGLAPGPDAWFAIMRGLAQAIAGCLERKASDG